MIVITEARTEQHCEDLVTLGQMMFNEREASHLVYEPDQVVSVFNAMCADIERSKLNAFISYDDGQPTGFLAASAFPFFFSSQRMSQSDLWYVIPAKRGGRTAVKLFKSYEDWARMQGCVEIWSGTSLGTMSAKKRVSKLLSKLGHRHVGFHHLKVTTHV